MHYDTIPVLRAFVPSWQSVVLSGAPTGRSRWLPLRTRPPANSAFLPRREPGDSNSQGLKKLGLNVVAQHPIQVYYDKAIVGDYFADILVENIVIIEIKAAKTIIIEHEAQLLNYLKATQLGVGLLLIFGPKAEFSRKAFDNSRKK